MCYERKAINVSLLIGLRKYRYFTYNVLKRVKIRNIKHGTAEIFTYLVMANEHLSADFV